MKANISDSISARIFRTLAQNMDRMLDFERRLRKDLSLTNVLSGTNLRNYSNGWMFEHYLEADVAGRGNVCWWFDLSAKENHWVIDTQVYISQGEPLKNFPFRYAATDEDLIEQIGLAFTDLIDTYDEGLLRN